MSMRSWLRNLFTRPATRSGRKAPHRGRPALEALEDRAVPATFTVLNINDSGPGSLRDAIAQAQSGPNLGVADQIVFGDGSGSGGTNFLDSTPDTISLTGGELMLTDAATTTITGPGASLLSISGNNASRVFLNFGASALSGLTITGGSGANSGGVANLGTAWLTDCTITGNSSASVGG